MNKSIYSSLIENKQSLDPENWTEFEDEAHAALNEMLNSLKEIRTAKSWTAIPDAVKKTYVAGVPTEKDTFSEVFNSFIRNILPYPTGNTHPKFWAWADGTGTPLSMIAEMLGAGMNANVCAGEHSPMYIEWQVLDWMKSLMGFPKQSSGIFVSGGAMSNLTALIVARNSFTGQKVRKHGINKNGQDLIIYTSVEAHSCISKAADIMGLGLDNVRKIPVDDNYKVRVDLLSDSIADDRKKGNVPFCVVGNVGTVNTGAIDPLSELASLCKKEGLWFHIDGAYGAAAKLIPEYKEELQCIEDADSLTFDLHKWFFMPFGVGCLLVKNSELHKDSFKIDVEYLFTHERGLASGPEMFADYGIEMSKRFRSLPLWFTLKNQGINSIIKIIRRNVAFSFYLKDLIVDNPKLEILAPVSLNVVCFRYNNSNLSSGNINSLNKELLMRLQEQGLATPSYTVLKGKYAIRLAIINHRTRKCDIDDFVEDCVLIGDDIANSIKI